MDLWRKNLYVLWATQFMAMVGMNLVVPFLPFYIRQLGVTDEAEVVRWSGLVFAGPFVSAFIATPFWGNLGDKYGRKPMVIRALFGLAISQILIGLSQNVMQVFLFRILQGAISGFIASALALVSTSAPRNRVGYALGVLQSASSGGVVLGPFFGGLLADLIGYREIFFVTAAFCTIGAIAVIYGVKEVRQGEPEGERYSVFDNYKLMYTNKQLRLVALCLVVGQVSVLMVEPIFALFVESFQSDTKYMATLAGSVFSVTGLFSIISAPWWGKRNDRKGYKKGLLIGMTLTGLAYVGHNLVNSILQLAFLRGLLGFRARRRVACVVRAHKPSFAFRTSGWNDCRRKQHDHSRQYARPGSGRISCRPSRNSGYVSCEQFFLRCSLRLLSGNRWRRFTSTSTRLQQPARPLLMGALRRNRE